MDRRQRQPRAARRGLRRRDHPIVTGTVDPGILDRLAAIILKDVSGTGSGLGAVPAGPGFGSLGGVSASGPAEGGRRGQQMTIGAVRQLAIGHAARLLSGPGGLASWLRTSQLHGYAASVSLPLDIGATTDTIPVQLRRAVARRDQHCRFPGCQQPPPPPAACHVHHLIPRADRGPTNLANCCLLCTFHHQVAVHRWGWNLTLNPDGW
ncbi:MAG: HNH endonuclease [Streptosporangiaceae bacterium]